MPDRRELAQEARLIAAYLRGDAAAGEAIRRCCAEEMRWAIDQTLPYDPELREEAVQGTWRRLFGSLADFQGRCLLRTYAKALARNECLDLLRRRRRLRARETELAEAEGISDRRHGSAREGPVWDCLEALPDPWQRVLLARAELPGKQCTELARAVDMDVEEVYEVLYQARRALRRCLESKGIPGKVGRSERQSERGGG